MTMEPLLTKLNLVLALCAIAIPPARAQTPLTKTEGASSTALHGVAVAMIGDLDGDGLDDVLVGESGVDTSVAEGGVVRIYSGGDGSLIRNVEGASAKKLLGTSVAVLDDLNGDGLDDFVAGAPGSGPLAADPGAAFVFSGADGSVLFSMNGDTANDSFGTSVAAAGDINGDGVADFAVGGSSSSVAAPCAGMTRVFSGVDGAELYTWYGRNWYEEFGGAIAGVGDADSDGFADVAVSAVYDCVPIAASGVVRVYSGKTGKVIRRFQGKVGASFGRSLAGLGDLNGDGRPEIAIGASSEDHPTNSLLFFAGSVHVYSITNGSLLQTVYGQVDSEGLGTALAAAGDWNGDGTPDFVAIAPHAPTSQVSHGVARVYSGADGAVLEEFFGPEQGDELMRVAVGELNGDGRSDLVVGGPFKGSAPGSGAGVAYTFLGGCDQIVSYCTAGVSASGCQALLSATGTGSASAASGFIATATGVEGGKDGIFFFGTSGRQACAWGTGTSLQCVTPPVKRGGLMFGSGTVGTCDGSFSQDLNAHWCPFCPYPDHNFGAGAVVQLQLWYRDPQSTSNQTTSLSDAIEFTLCP